MFAADRAGRVRYFRRPGHCHRLRYSLTLSVTVDAGDGSVPDYNPNLLSASVVEGGIQLDFTDGEFGTVNVLVRATDQAGEYVETTVRVTVPSSGGSGGSNSPPEVADAIADFSAEAEQGSSVFDLTHVFADAEVAAGSDSLAYSVTSSDETLVAASIHGDNLTLSYFLGQLGSATITLRATDSHNEMVETSFSVTVVPFNNPPTATPLPPITVDEDAADQVFNLWDYFADAEDADDQLTFDIALGPESYWSPFDATIDPATGQLTLSFPPDASGQADYVVSATDAGGKSVLSTLSVTVNEVNDLPTGPASLVTVTLLDAPQETVVDLWEYFGDVEDGPDMTYEILDATVTNRTMFAGGPTIDTDDFLRATASDVTGGTSQITIRATDASGASVTGTFEFRTAPPTVSIVDTKHTGETAAKAGHFEVKLTGTPTGIVEVPFTLTAALGASAAAGLPAANYTVSLSNSSSTFDAATQSGVLKFDGAKLVKLTIDAPDDADKEGATSVSLALSSGTNYNAGTMSDTMRIYDDDSGAVVYIAQVKHTREGAAESDYGEFVLESIGKTLPFEWCALNNGASCDDAPADAVFMIWDDDANALVPWTNYPNVPEYKVSYQLTDSVAALPGDGDYTVTMGSLASNKSAKIAIIPPPDDGDEVDEFVKLKLVPRSGPWGIVQTAAGDHLGCFQTGSYALGAPDVGTVTIQDSANCSCQSPIIQSATDSLLNISYPLPTIPIESIGPIVTVTETIVYVSHLNSVVANWRNNGWDFAADLLAKFLTQYDMPIGQVHDFSRHALRVKNDKVFDRLMRAKLTAIAQSNFQATPHFTNGLARARRLDLPDNDPAFSIRWYDGELFYAFGGARVGYTNAKLCLTEVSPNVIEWTFSGEIRVWDVYTFRPTEYGVRLLFPSYFAAHQLETRFGYTPFTSQVLFHAEYRGTFANP